MASIEELQKRLRNQKFSRRDCQSAIHGQHVPDALGLPLHRFCTIRGIRYHHGFAQELRGTLPEFTRALNARAIMSNDIPEMSNPEDAPYCIWHPDMASEETYRTLVQRYPAMAYQVGRACAVAGYFNLYTELNILPEVHIAEEARECESLSIFESIMSHRTRFAVMNDYQRTVTTEDAPPAHLNGDTAVRWMLDEKQALSTIHDSIAVHGYPGLLETTFNITEDMNIDDVAISDIVAHRRQVYNYRVVDLLSERLPRDLPIVNKDLLIVMAAYYGDIDRYTRLRRPRMVDTELECCIRGIYHNTMFAIWWSKQPMPRLSAYRNRQLRQAIEARFIMNNVLSRVCQDEFEEPYLIWHPSIAAASTYRELARLRPSMLPQILRAAIAAGYSEVFDDLIDKVAPDAGILAEAEARGDPRYLEALQKIVRERKIDTELSSSQQWKKYTRGNIETSSIAINGPGNRPVVTTCFEGLYNGAQCDARSVELLASLPEDWKKLVAEHGRPVDLDYVKWPGMSKGP